LSVIVASGLRPDVEGGILPLGLNRDLVRRDEFLLKRLGLWPLDSNIALAPLMLFSNV